MYFFCKLKYKVFDIFFVISVAVSMNSVYLRYWDYGGWAYGSGSCLCCEGFGKLFPKKWV